MPTPSAGTASLATRAEQAQQLADRLAAAADTTSLDAVLATVRARFDSDGAHLALLTDRQHSAGSCVRAGIAPTPRGTEAPYEDTICSNILRVDDALAIPDTQADDRVSSVPAVRAEAVGSYLGVPIRINGSIVGVLCVWNEQPNEWTAEDIATLQSLGDDVLAGLLEVCAPPD